MASQLKQIAPEDYVVELGPGTGVITRSICKLGINPKRLILIEREHRFIEQLKRDFPESIIVQGDARNIKELLAKQGIEQVGAVLCCLPLLNMPEGVRHMIVNAAFEVMKPAGLFVLYTYGWFSPVSRHSQSTMGIRGKVAKRIWRNFPPAKIWNYVAQG